jgi:hypothetical protein
MPANLPSGNTFCQKTWVSALQNADFAPQDASNALIASDVARIIAEKEVINVGNEHTNGNYVVINRKNEGMCGENECSREAGLPPMGPTPHRGYAEHRNPNFTGCDR